MDFGCRGVRFGCIVLFCLIALVVCFIFLVWLLCWYFDGAYFDCCFVLCWLFTWLVGLCCLGVWVLCLFSGML